MGVAAVGIDPGVQFTGLAAVDGRRLVDAKKVKGVRGAGRDWPLLVRTARLIAVEASAWVQHHDPRVVGIESMDDQGKDRRRFSNRHTTAAVCQALYDQAAVDGWADLITWQKAVDALRHDRGYGTLKYVLEQGRAPAGVWSGGPLDEHSASAAAHGWWAEAAYRSAVGGR